MWLKGGIKELEPSVKAAFFFFLGLFIACTNGHTSFYFTYLICLFRKLFIFILENLENTFRKLRKFKK